MIYSKVAIFGMGLIGGSIGIDLKEKGLAQQVCGWGRNPEHLKQAVDKKACDTTTADVCGAVKDAEIIILATPPRIIIDQLNEIKPFLKQGMLIMDVGSVKAAIIEASRQAGIYKTGAEFLGSHPMAGSEKTGVTNAYAGMLKDAPCILTPESNNTEKGVEKGKKFWQELGADVIIMNPNEHDLFIGFLSHLPHLVSSTLVATSAEKLKNLEIMSKLCGPSFVELTRIADSPPAMWSQIFMENRGQLLLAIDVFIETLLKFKGLLLRKEDKKLEEFLQQIVKYRSKICP